MSRERRVLLAGAVLFAIVAALLTAPARLLPVVLDGQPLRASGLSGTLWRGEAARAVLELPGGTLHLGRLRWRLEALSLFTLSPRIAVDTQWGQQRVALRLQRRGTQDFRLRDVAATVDARIVQYWLPVQLRGVVEAAMPRLEVSAGMPVRAEGRVVWRDAAWLGPAGLQGLGTYLLELETGSGESITGTVDTLSGPVRAGGTLALADGRYRVDARLGPAAAMDADLRQALSLVAVPEENGYLLRLDGALAAPP